MVYSGIITKELVPLFINKYLLIKLYTRYCATHCIFCSDQDWEVPGVLVQDGDIGRSWTHLFPLTHWIYSYIRNSFLWEKPKAWLSSSNMLGKGKKKTSKRLGKAGIQFHQKLHPRHCNPQSGGNLRPGASPWGTDCTSQQAPQVLRPALKRQAPKTYKTFKNQQAYKSITKQKWP